MYKHWQTSGFRYDFTVTFITNKNLKTKKFTKDREQKAPQVMEGIVEDIGRTEVRYICAFCDNML